MPILCGFILEKKKTSIIVSLFRSGRVRWTALGFQWHFTSKIKGVSWQPGGLTWEKTIYWGKTPANELEHDGSMKTARLSYWISKWNRCRSKEVSVFVILLQWKSIYSVDANSLGWAVILILIHTVFLNQIKFSYDFIWFI